MNNDHQQTNRHPEPRPTPGRLPAPLVSGDADFETALERCHHALRQHQKQIDEVLQLLGATLQQAHQTASQDENHPAD